MSEDGNVWPLPKFWFSVKWEDMEEDMTFQEITGLGAESNTIEYRAGNSPVFSSIKPDVSKLGNVIMRHGVIMNDNAFWNWYSQIQLNTTRRQTVTIKLMDETDAPQMMWTLSNAWPSKITGTDLKSDINKVMIANIEVVHEGLTISKA